MLLRRAVQSFFADDMVSYAAALAYYILFSSFPFIVFLGTLLRSFEIPGFFDRLLFLIRLVVPRQVVELAEGIVTEMLEAQDGSLLSFGVVTAILSTSIGVRALIRALNAAYKVPETRRGWKYYALSLGFTFGLAGVLILAAILLSVSPGVLAWLAGYVGQDRIVVTLWAWLRVPVALLLMTLVVALVYHVIPNAKHRFRVITPGAVVTVVGWIVASVGFSWYLTYLSDYSLRYGSLGVAAVLLVYYYILAAVLLFGAEINAVIAGYTEGQG